VSSSSRFSDPTDRREFLRRTAFGGAAAFFSPGLLAALVRSTAGPASRAPTGDGYGPLRPAGPELALPEGFEYAVIGRAGEPMSDGTPTPIAHDGMAAFEAPDGLVRLIRNHEVRDPPGVSLIGERETAYDPLAGGGTTTLDVRIGDAGIEVVRDFVSLNGTLINCAGGRTPWGSWISCEETTEGPGRGFGRPHGYAFEVPVDADGAVEATPLRALGRFVHEALAVDPDTGIAYLTEDLNPAGFYRFLPAESDRVAEGGRLQVLAVDGSPGYDTRFGQTIAVRRPVRWVDIPDVDPPDAESDPHAVFRQGAGAASFSRLEGCGWGPDGIWFHATDGGDAGCGQVWLYRPDEGAGADPEGPGTLELVFESPRADILDQPDNLTVSPRGGVVICEDCDGAIHLRGLSPEGEVFPFARNLLNLREFAGVCYDPEGRVLFFNLQGDTVTGRVDPAPSMTFAVWGPWARGSL
jgi:secreted PhoX family phosphatase